MGSASARRPPGDHRLPALQAGAPAYGGCDADANAWPTPRSWEMASKRALNGFARRHKTSFFAGTTRIPRRNSLRAPSDRRHLGACRVPCDYSVACRRSTKSSQSGTATVAQEPSAQIAIATALGRVLTDSSVHKGTALSRPDADRDARAGRFATRRCGHRGSLTPRSSFASVSNTREVHPMITEKAMLAAVHISIWTAVKHDRKIRPRRGGSTWCPRSAGRYNKQLLARSGKARTNCDRSPDRSDSLPTRSPCLLVRRRFRLLPVHFYSRPATLVRSRSRASNAVSRIPSEIYPHYIEQVTPELNGLFPRGRLPGRVEKLRTENSA